jgi:steroid delta-isomerase-like uncharacterized protein
MQALKIAKNYYDYFNEKNWEGMLSLVHEEIKHEANQSATRVGKKLFAEFLEHMNQCYEETLTDMVFFSETSDKRVAVEFVVNGTYKSTDGDLPEANGQKYILPAAAFLEISDNKIIRVTTYYNLPLWMELVSK